MPNYLELFTAGGIPLVLCVAFLYSQHRMMQYFIQQIQEANHERTELSLERQQTVTKFDEMLGNHCRTVSDTMAKQTETLNKQNESFVMLLSKVDTLVSQLNVLIIKENPEINVKQ